MSSKSTPTAIEALALRIAAALRERGETVAIAESSSGGLAAAALLSVPGASAYFVGGAIIYSSLARTALLGLDDSELANLRPETEAYAALIARRIRDRHEAAWGLGERGATGPKSSRYGDSPGHVCLSVAGPVIRTRTIELASSDRSRNMSEFARQLLSLFDETLTG